MPHPLTEIDYLPPLENFVYKQVLRKGAIYTQYTGNYRRGKHTYLYRSASTNNPKDSTGWRKPAPYEFHRYSGDGFYPVHYTKTGAQFYDGRPGYFQYNYPHGYPSITPKFTWTWANLQRFLFPDLYYYLVVEATVRNRALVKLKDQKWNMSVCIAESVKTYHMVRDLVLELVEVVRLLRKGRNPFGGKLFSKSLHNRWLEVRYGWLPALKDISGQMEWLDKLISGDRRGMRIRVTAFEDVIRTSTATWGATSPNHTWSGTQRIQARWKGVYWWYVNDDSFHRLNDLGYQEPYAVAWELVPYSFVVDWFLPIGTYLEALLADTGMDYLGGSMTRILKGEGLATVASTDSNVYPDVAGENYRDESYFSMKRTVEAKPHATLVPSLNVLDLGEVRIMDAIALLYNALTGKGSNRRYRI